MTAPGRYAASDGSFAKSAGSAAARGGILIAIAVVIGFALLAWGFDGGDSDAGGAAPPETTQPPDTTGSTAPTDSIDPTTTDPTGSVDPTDTSGTTAPVELDDPSSIRVAVLNGTDTGGLAGQRADTLGALNYVTTAGNAANRPIEASKVYFTTGFGDEAKVVAEALSGSSSVLELAPDDPATLEDGTQADAASANIIVVLGTDNALQ